jgi:hypothetical protein
MEPENFRLRTQEVTDDAKYNFPSDLPLRPGINTTGKAIQIRVNQFKVTKWPERDIYQYDVSFNFTLNFDFNNTKLTAFADQRRKWCREERQDHGRLDVPCSSRAPQAGQSGYFHSLGWQQAALVCSNPSLTFGH